MSNDNEPATVAELKAANQELADSLERCHALVADYREALATARKRPFLLSPRSAPHRT